MHGKLESKKYKTVKEILVFLFSTFLHFLLNALYPTSRVDINPDKNLRFPAISKGFY